MPTREEIDAVKSIMDRSKELTKKYITQESENELNEIIDGFDKSTEKYLKNKEKEGE